MRSAEQRAALKTFIENCRQMGVSIDQMMAKVMAGELCVAAISGKNADEVLGRIEHILGDYREIILMRLEEKHGIKEEGIDAARSLP